MRISSLEASEQRRWTAKYEDRLVAADVIIRSAILGLNLDAQLADVVGELSRRIVDPQEQRPGLGELDFTLQSDRFGVYQRGDTRQGLCLVTDGSHQHSQGEPLMVANRDAPGLAPPDLRFVADLVPAFSSQQVAAAGLNLDARRLPSSVGANRDQPPYPRCG